MAESGVTVYTPLYPDLKEFYSEGVVETGSSVDLPIFFRSHIRKEVYGSEDRDNQGQTEQLNFWGLQPTAPPPSESHFDLSHTLDPFDLEDLQLDFDHLNFAPDEPELDYTFDLEPDYEVDDVTTPSPHNVTTSSNTSRSHNANNTVTTASNNNASNRGGREFRGGKERTRQGLNNLNLTLKNLNLNDVEKKLLRDKNIEVPPSHPPISPSKDFNAWMTWRLQANKLLAALILIRSGRRVHLRHSEVYRKPLTRQNVHSIVREAKDGDGDPRCGQKTSLSGCPYIMYGIPRVKLTHTAPAPVADKPAATSNLKPSSSAVAAPKHLTRLQKQKR